jgi:hypothetical protein
MCNSDIGLESFCDWNNSDRTEVNCRQNFTKNDILLRIVSFVLKITQTDWLSVVASPTSQSFTPVEMLPLPAKCSALRDFYQGEIFIVSDTPDVPWDLPFYPFMTGTVRSKNLYPGLPQASNHPQLWDKAYHSIYRETQANWIRAMEDACLYIRKSDCINILQHVKEVITYIYIKSNFLNFKSTPPSPRVIGHINRLHFLPWLGLQQKNIMG